MKLIFADEAWEDYLYWQKQDRRMVERINKLIKETQREPFTGVGKPEPLKHALAGFWSRRITDEHRMVYRVEGDALSNSKKVMLTKSESCISTRSSTRFLRCHHPELPSLGVLEPSMCISSCAKVFLSG